MYFLKMRTSSVFHVSFCQYIHFKARHELYVMSHINVIVIYHIDDKYIGTQISTKKSLKN